MFAYPKRKTSEFWEGIKWNVWVTLIALVASIVAALFNPYGWRENHPVYYGAYIVAVFIVTVFICVGVYFISHYMKGIVNRDKILFDLDFSTKPGRPIFGRYVAMCIHNRSAWDIESCYVMLKEVKAIKGKWKPSERIGFDPLLWGSVMLDRNGKKTIERNNDPEKTVVDILHTGDNKTGGRIYFTIQNIGEIIDAPVGSYLLTLAIFGNHLGKDFEIPVSLMVVFDGGMVISQIKPNISHLDKRIKNIRVFHDGRISAAT